MYLGSVPSGDVALARAIAAQATAPAQGGMVAPGVYAAWVPGSDAWDNIVGRKASETMFTTMQREADSRNARRRLLMIGGAAAALLLLPMLLSRKKG